MADFTVCPCPENSGVLVVEHDIQQRTVNQQTITAVIVDESQFPESVHEKVNPPAGRSHHLGESLLTDFGDRNFLLPLLAEVSKQEKNASESFLTEIEKLIHQICFVSDVPGQQVRYEHVGKRWFSVNYIHHGFLLDAHYRAVGHRDRGAQAARLSCEGTVSEEITLVQNGYCGFLPAHRHNGESYLSLLYIENRISRVTLSKDHPFVRKGRDCSTAVDGREEGLEIEFAPFLGRGHWCHGWLPSNA